MPVKTRTFEIDIRSELPAAADTVWRRVVTPAGVNDELWPIRMTFPPDFESIDEAPTGQRLFRSRITLLGLLPLDWHNFGLVSVEPGRGFHEESTSLWMRRWMHKRTLTPAGTGTIVRDRVEFTPRLPGVGLLLAPLYRRIFERRHARLRRAFGGRAV